MPDQPAGAQANDDVTEEGLIASGQEYDELRLQRVEEQNKSEELGDGRSRKTGVVVSGEGDLPSATSLFPGAATRGLADDASQGGVAARAAKGLDTEGVTADDTSWTAQGAGAYVSSNAEDVPGQTFVVAELPDPAVVSASNLPSHTIPEGLVVDANGGNDSPAGSSQERGGDLSTPPKRVGEDRVALQRNADPLAEREGVKASDELPAVKAARRK